MKKRIISMLLVVAMAITFFPSSVRADFAVPASQPVILVENAWAVAGSTVEVNVVISGNPGILGATLTISWAEGLTLIDAENGDAFVNLSFQGANNYKPTGTNFVWYGNKLNAVKDGTVLKLTFKTDENVTEDSRLVINVSGSGIIDTNKESVSPIFASGGVRIVNYTPGDVDGNEEIDTPDLIMLAKYIVDGCTTDPDGYNVSPNLNASDVNDDGEYTALDLVLISQYIVDGCKTDPDGYNVVLKPVTPKCGHAGMEEHAYLAPTCTADGHVTYFYCDDCGLYFNDNVGTIELLWEQIVLASNGHNVVIDQAVAPTYTSTGLTEGSHCSVCGEVFAEQEEVPMLQANHHSITYRNLNGAEAPDPSSYAEHIGLAELPVPVAPGYTFKGWYTASEGGQIVDYIPAGSTQDYILYARWELITYTINYFEAPNYEGVTTYTVEDEIYLPEPNWPGLGFTGWTEENGNVTTEQREGRVAYKIAPGTTGNLKLTANWKLMRNIATPGNNRTMLAKYNDETGHYIFIYELGTIENVVLEQMSSSLLYQHTGAGDFTLEMASENTLEESIADSITRTISRSVSSSSEWESSKDWAKENSDEHSTHVDIGLEFGDEKSFVHASIETGYGYAHTSTSSWGGSESKGGSYGEETENGEEVGSSFSYLTSLTTSSLTSVTISADAPKGYYDYVQAGNIRVFGVVTYIPNEDPTKEGTYYLNTYSMLDNMHGVVLYYPNVNDLNNPTCETLQYNVPREDIKAKIDASYFIQYDANGGVGKMHDTLHTVGGTEKLEKNTFTRVGYRFMGWETRGKVEGQDDPVSTGTYTDEQIINTALASEGAKVTMYAVWEKNDYTIEYQDNKPTLGSTYVDYLPGNTACKYDEDVTLGAAPTLAGYTFGGWYYDSTCTQKAGDAGETLPVANLTSEHKGVVKLYAKWTANTYTLSFELNGGTMDTTSKSVVFDKQYGSLGVPQKADHVFVGWYLEDGTTEIKADDYVRINEDHKVYAKWLKSKATIYQRDDIHNPGVPDVRIDDDDVFWHEMVDPGFDKAELILAGYTQLHIVVRFDLCEIDQGNQWMRLEAWYDKENTVITEWKYNSTPSGWTYYEESYTIPLDSSYTSETCAFYVGYDAWGNGNDDWWLGDTCYTVTALKN